MTESLDAYYGLPAEVTFCTRCVMSNQRPASYPEFKHKKDRKAPTLHIDADHSQADAYLDNMRRLGGLLTRFGPDLVIYQAGADTHVDDPLGGLLTSDQMRERDSTMFAIARRLSIPLTWNLAGGYQIEADGSIPRVVELHLNTFEEALKVWHLL